MNDDDYVTLLLVLSVFFVAILGIYLFIQSRKSDNGCKEMNAKYDVLNNAIISLNPNDVNCQQTLRNYIVMSAFNCCNVGSIRNGACNTCALKSVLKQGVRFLDFQVFSINNLPVVAASTDSSYYVKETLNSVPFENVMQTIIEYAFSVSNAPNPYDPIFLHFRFFSQNKEMYENLAEIFKKYDDKFLDSTYSFENHGKNFGDTPLLTLQNKIVVFVDKTNNSFMDSKKFSEYVNMTSNSIFMRSLAFSDVKNTPDLAELQKYNCHNMTIVVPDNQSNPENPKHFTCREAGCNFIAMQFQNDDTFLEEQMQFFKSCGYAFSLKQACPGVEQTTIPVPKPQDPLVSYAPREIKTNNYSFNM
jgi:hypothetical protein